MIHSDTFAVRTLVTMAHQRLGLEEPRCLSALGLAAAGAAIDRALHGALSRHNLTQLQFELLVVLIAVEPWPVAPADLAYYTGFTRSSVSSAIGELQHRGCLTAARSTLDRRSIDARLTDVGRRLIEAAIPDYLQVLGSLVALFNSEDASTIRRLCDRLVSAVPGAPTDLPSPSLS